MLFEIFVAVHVQSVTDYDAVISIYKTGNKKVEQESITSRHATTVTKTSPR